MRIARIATAGVFCALAMGLTGCVLPTVVLNNIRPITFWDMPDPTAVVDGGNQYTYATQAQGRMVPVLSPSGLSEALTKKPDWAAGPPAQWFSYTAGPDVRWNLNTNKYMMYFTATPSSSSQPNQGNCIGVAVANDLTHFVPEAGSLKCGEVWDPDVEFIGNQPVLLFSTTAGIKSVRLSADGKQLAGADTLLVPKGTDANTYENPTAFYDGAASEWVMLFSYSDWRTIFYQTKMAYCGGNLDLQCNVQGQRGSFPFNNVASLGMYGTGGMDLFTAADGSMDAVFHYYATGNTVNRIAAQADVSVTDPNN